ETDGAGAWAAGKRTRTDWSWRLSAATCPRASAIASRGEPIFHERRAKSHPLKVHAMQTNTVLPNQPAPKAQAPHVFPKRTKYSSVSATLLSLWLSAPLRGDDKLRSARLRE